MKTYQDLINLLSVVRGRPYVAVFYVTGTYEWLPLDVNEYLRQLRMIGNPEIPFPCYFDHDADGDVFIHPKVENKG